MSSSQEAKIAGAGRHVLMVSFPAWGHIIPMLNLARKISKFHSVTFALSASFLRKLSERELIQSHENMQLHGVPDDATKEATDDVAFENGELIPFFDAVLPGFAELFRTVPTQIEPGKLNDMDAVDVVIADFFLGSVLNICHERNVPFHIFNTSNTWEVEYVLALNDNTPTVPDDQTDLFQPVPIPPAPGAPIPPVGQDCKAVFQPMKKFLHLASGLIINSYRDIELETLRRIESDPQLNGVTMFCVGPLLEETSEKTSAPQLATEKKVTVWLDAQSENSVIYVSFGSVATPTPLQLEAICDALLNFKRPFIWTIRERFHKLLAKEIRSKISSQFTEVNSKFLILNWAPQKLVLKHPAVAVFVSHCGWNSTLESLASGTPIVSWPMFGDQLDIAHWVVGLGAGVRIPNTGILGHRIVPAEEIEEAIETVAVWEGRKESAYKTAAKNWQKKINSAWSQQGSSYQEFLSLVEFRQKL